MQTKKKYGKPHKPYKRASPLQKAFSWQVPKGHEQTTSRNPAMSKRTANLYLMPNPEGTLTTSNLNSASEQACYKQMSRGKALRNTTKNKLIPQMSWHTTNTYIMVRPKGALNNLILTSDHAEALGLTTTIGVLHIVR